MAKMIVITATSQDAKKIERRHGDLKTVRWMGAVRLETEQLMRVDGHAEILLELAAARGIDNVSVVREWDAIDVVYSDSTDFDGCSIAAMEAAQALHKENHGGSDGGNNLPDPEDDAQDIHIYADGKYISTTNLFSKRSSALKYYRNSAAFQGEKVTARLALGYNNKAVKEETGKDYTICN